MHVVSGEQIAKWQDFSDEEIVTRVTQGQTALFEVLMRRHNERIYRAARAIVRNDAEAEDVMQQAYVNAYAHLRQFDRRAAFATWLTRIAVHEAFARIRRHRRDAEYQNSAGGTPTMHTAPYDPERQALARELQSLVETAVDGLPDGQREVFMLRDVEGLSTSETAACLDVTEEAVRTRLTRARALLRRSLYERAGLAASNAFSFQRPRCDRVVAAVLQRIA